MTLGGHFDDGEAAAEGEGEAVGSAGSGSAGLGSVSRSAAGSASSAGAAVYITVGTGIGAGVALHGRVLTGLLHPEAGHIAARRHPSDPASEFAGLCPFHGDCVEGLATANAIAARLRIPVAALAALPDDHPCWSLAAFYLAQLCAAVTLILSPSVIVMGGGVIRRRTMLPLIRAALVEQLNGYLRVKRITDTPEKYLVSSRFDAEGSNTSAGAVGTLAFARHAWEVEQKRKAREANETETQQQNQNQNQQQSQ